jgi:hypothetical protein
MNGAFSRRFFNKNFDRQLENLLSKLPQGNIGYGIVGLNTAFYLMYNMWPSHNIYSFYNNFTFALPGLYKGHIWSMATCHFTHLSFFSYALDSVILFMFCQNLG